MKRIIIFTLLAFIATQLTAQNTPAENDTLVDTKYREDQFYLAVTFNLLVNKPDNLQQNGFSGGLHFGAIRDMPINAKRNWAIGLGAGFSMNTYNQNLLIGETTGKSTTFEIIESNRDYNKNWLSTYLVEFPLQLRWRTSTPTTNKFWRIYSGVQLGYIFAHKANFEDTATRIVNTDIPELEKLRYAATFSFGYETFNFYFQYNITPFFNSDVRTIDDQALELNNFKLGLIFYIL